MSFLANAIAAKMDKRIAERRRVLVTEQRAIPKALDRLSLQEKSHTEHQGGEGERRAAELRTEMERHQARFVEVEQELAPLEQALCPNALNQPAGAFYGNSVSTDRAVRDQVL